MSDENPAQRWIDSVEDPDSVVSQFGTTYSAEGDVARATGVINRPNVDQWGDPLPVESRTVRTLGSVYKTISDWKSYLSGTPIAEKNPYVNPQWGKENIRTVRDVMGAAPTRSVGMK
jgi:hypothetical protein